MLQYNQMDLINDLSKKLNRKPTVQEIEDEIFRLMPASQKIKTTSDLIAFAKELNQLDYGNNRSTETSSQGSSDTR